MIDRTKSVETNDSHIRDGWQWSLLEGFVVTLTFGDAHLAQISESLRLCVWAKPFHSVVSL